MKILLHSCCAPCSIIPVDDLKGEHAITLYWYNPNIHPSMEYLARRTALDTFADREGLAVIDERIYDMERFLASVKPAPPERCLDCYRMRFDATARAAVAGGFDAFTSTVLYSPYQTRELVLKAGNEAAAFHGTRFLEYDWRDRYREGQDRSREMDLYRQKYCGCVYSEKERYAKKLKGYVDSHAGT